MPQRITKPARFERVRTFLARIIYCYLTIPTRIALWLTPKNHPWRAMSESVYNDYRELTWTTLRPRRESGEVVAVLERPSRVLTSVMWLVVAYVVYAATARTTELLPALLPYLTDDSVL